MAKTKFQQKLIKGKFKPSPTAEREFYRALKKVAQNSGHIVEAHIDGVKLINEGAMQDALNKYAELITPWAERQANKMVEQVQRSNKRAYQNKAKALGVELKKEILTQGKQQSFTGAMVRALQAEHVKLIKSIPVEAGRRAQDLALKAAVEGRRATPDQATIDEIKKQLGLSTEVATSRAELIAVTETAKANAMINQARAQEVGSTHYRWHNSHDGAVRESHKKLRGKPIGDYIFSWDDPPTLDDGMTGNPGEFPRCRCFAEPIFDEVTNKKTLYKSKK